MQSLLQDLRFGIRMMVKSSGFSLAAIATLALGIGANTAMFSVVYHVLLRPLPFPEQGRLVAVEQMNTRLGPPSPSNFSYPDYWDVRERNRSFTDIAAYNNNDYTLTGTGEPIHVSTEIVSAGFFDVLGVQPQLGRGFAREEDAPGHHVIVLSHRLWTRQFQGDRAVLGRTVTLSGRNHTIVGVMPEGFQFPVRSQAIDLWTTYSKLSEPDAPGESVVTEQRGAHFLEVIGRLKPGVTAEQATADVTAIAQALAAQDPEHNKYMTVTWVRPQVEYMVGGSARALKLLLVAVGLVLLIACANVANLLLARSTARAKEIAIRSALGASVSRIVRQLMTESLALALAGAAAGTGLAIWALSVIVKVYPSNLPRLAQVSIDPRVLLFTTGLVLVSSLLFGLVPALRVARPQLTEAMQAGGRTSGSAQHNRLRSALVISQTALGLMLLIGAGLLIRSLDRLRHVELGFNPEHLLTANFDLSQTRYNSDQQDQFYQELLRRVRTVPGVIAAGAAMPMPLSNDEWSISFNLLDHPAPKSDDPSAGFYIASPGLFQAMQVPLIGGRLFDERDQRNGPQVMIINQAFAQKFFPKEDPLGRRIKIGAGDGKGRPKERTVVGIVGNVRSATLTQNPRAAYYVPLSQMIWSPPSLVIRTANNPLSVVEDVRKTLAGMDAEAPLFDVRSMDDVLALDLGEAKFQTLLLSVFAGIALLLTAIGLYGVMAYSVAQRTQEIGIRIALGASRSDVLRMVLHRGAILTGAGLLAGIVGALALTGFMEKMLFDTKPFDPMTIGAVSMILAAIALLASYLPARRATKVDPLVTLRVE
jgi:predicted permease